VSREAVNQIIERAIADDSFFELLRNNPDQAIQGYALDESELSALRAGAYNVVVRGMRKDREDQAVLQARKTAGPSIAAAPEPSAVGGPRPEQPRRAPVASIAAFLIWAVIIGGGIGGFRYFERQWPWQALGFGKPAAQAAIPSPSLGARPKPSGQAAASPSTSEPAQPAAKPSTPNSSAPAQLRPSPTPAPSAGASAAAASGQSLDIERAYYQAVGSRLAKVVKDFSTTLGDLRAGNDATNDVSALSNDASDLRQHLNDAPPPDALKRQHAALLQAVPLLQGDIDQLKSALAQKNNDQAILIAAEMDALLNQVSDEVQFATTPHPELYQAINSSTPLTHVLNFDVLGQNVVARSNAPSNVTVRIALQAPNPSPDEVSDTLRHGVVAARQTYPQAGQVRVVGFSENNGTVGTQVGTADWYCSPDAKPPDANQLSSWQDACSRIYITLPGSPPKALPY
jgi:hypothetical protein